MAVGQADTWHPMTLDSRVRTILYCSTVLLKVLTSHSVILVQR